MNRCSVPVAHRGYRRQQIGFMAQRDLPLLLHHLECQDHISGFILDLTLQLHFSAVAQNEQRRAGKARDEQNQGRQQFRAEFQKCLSGLRTPQSKAT